MGSGRARHFGKCGAGEGAQTLDLELGDASLMSMRVVDRAAAPASRNMNIRGYGSRLALRLAGTTEWFDLIFKQLTRHTSAISRREPPKLKHEGCPSKEA